MHMPTLPNPDFAGKTGNGDWADCLAEMDYRTRQILDAIKQAAHTRGLDALCAVQGERLVVVLGGVTDVDKAAGSIASHFGEGAIVTGPAGPMIESISGNAASAPACCS